MSSIDLALTEQIIKRLASSGAVSLKIKSGDSQLNLVRGGNGTGFETPRVVTSAPAGADNGLLDEQEQMQTVRVTAQLVGTYRNLQKPVYIGQTVIEGQPLGNIESMSILNEINATITGVISNIHLAEGDPAEYGTLLFELAPVDSLDDELGV